MTYVDNVCMSEYGFIVCVVWLFLDISVSWIFFNDLRCDDHIQSHREQNSI